MHDFLFEDYYSISALVVTVEVLLLLFLFRKFDIILVSGSMVRRTWYKKRYKKSKETGSL